VLFHVPVTGRPQVTPRSEAVRAQWLRPGDVGVVDEPTAQALATFAGARRPGAHTGRLLQR
jgi:hypothetical protein